LASPSYIQYRNVLLVDIIALSQEADRSRAGENPGVKTVFSGFYSYEKSGLAHPLPFWNSNRCEQSKKFHA
jgi:hypothetical protein